MEAPAEAAEAAEDVDGMPDRGGVSFRSPIEKIGLWRVSTARGKRGNGHGVRWCDNGEGSMGLS